MIKSVKLRNWEYMLDSKILNYILLHFFFSLGFLCNQTWFGKNGISVFVTCA
jgi:hypothetical protein